MICWFQRFSNNSMPFFCIRICLWPQNTPQFLISLLHWSQISFTRAFFWGLQTASSHWEPGLENRVGVEAIWSAIHVVLSPLRSTCDTVHCLGERALFSSSFVAVFWWFLPSNATIMLYDICSNDPGDLGSIPGRVIPKTQKMVLDASLLNTQHYKVRIKGKVE